VRKPQRAMNEHDGLLDYFGEFDPDTRIVVVKHCYQETVAHLYAARLKAAGIPCFISNANTITALPLGAGGIGLHIRERDLQEALAVITRLDRQLEQAPQEQSFHEADLDEIRYQESLHRKQWRTSDHLIALVLLLALLIVMRAFLRAGGWVESWRDFF